jgi:hypothetical protein
MVGLHLDALTRIVAMIDPLGVNVGGIFPRSGLSRTLVQVMETKHNPVDSKMLHCWEPRGAMPKRLLPFVPHQFVVE